MLISSTWKNGVVQREEGLYELPSDTPGVAARVRVKPRLWGLLGARVEAQDCQGNPLDAYQSFSGQLVARDPRSGLETVLDPRKHTLSVSCPEVKREGDSSQYILREEYFSTCRQEVDGDGGMRFVIGLHGKREINTPPAKAGAPASILLDDQTWTEVQLHPGSAPEGHEVSQDMRGQRREGAAVEACVDPHGRLVLVGQDGVSTSYEMYFHP